MALEQTEHSLTEKSKQRDGGGIKTMTASELCANASRKTAECPYISVTNGVLVQRKHKTVYEASAPQCTAHTLELYTNHVYGLDGWRNE